MIITKLAILTLWSINYKTATTN